MREEERPGEIAGIELGEGEPWEPWETKLVVWSIAVGLLVLLVGGYLVHTLILAG